MKKKQPDFEEFFSSTEKMSAAHAPTVGHVELILGSTEISEKQAESPTQLNTKSQPKTPGPYR